jgi:hypothetical protein
MPLTESERRRRGLALGGRRGARGKAKSPARRSHDDTDSLLEPLVINPTERGKFPDGNYNYPIF